MTNKLVFIINSLKVPKIKEILLFEMKFLVPNYSWLQNPWLGAAAPQIPVLSSAEFVELPLNKIPGYATAPVVSKWQNTVQGRIYVMLLTVLTIAEM